MTEYFELFKLNQKNKNKKQQKTIFDF